MSETRDRDINYARKIFCYKYAKEYGYKLKEIAGYIGRKINIVNKNIQNIKKEKRLNSNEPQYNK